MNASAQLLGSTAVKSHSWRLTACLALMLVCLLVGSGTMVFLRPNTGSGADVNADAILLSDDYSDCSSILKQGIYNIYHVTDHYALDSALSKYDEQYSYEAYQHDYAQAHSTANSHRHSGSSETHASVSASYGVISASVSAGHSQTHSDAESASMMSRSQFQTRSAQVKAEKHDLSRSESNRKDNEIVRKSVSDEVRRMYDQCVRFRGSQMLFHDDMQENGMLVISARYVLGNNLES